MLVAALLVTFSLAWTGASSIVPVQNNYVELHSLQTQVLQLINQTDRLTREVQSKNDLTQFLQADVIALNKSLVVEKQKTASLEARVATLETQLQNTLASFGETQGDLRSTKTLVQTLQTQLTSTNDKLNQLVRDQTSINASFIHSMDLLNSSIATAVQNAQKDSEVYFSTRGLETTSNFTRNSHLKYKVILSNVGNGYDSTSGMFTAPSSGAYWFSVTLSGATDDHVSCYLMRNGTDYLMEVYISAFSAYSSASTSTLVHLTFGDKVSVSQCTGSGDLSQYKSSFSGFLL